MRTERLVQHLPAIAAAAARTAAHLGAVPPLAAAAVEQAAGQYGADEAFIARASSVTYTASLLSSTPWQIESAVHAALQPAPGQCERYAIADRGEDGDLADGTGEGEKPQPPFQRPSQTAAGPESDAGTQGAPKRRCQASEATCSMAAARGSGERELPATADTTAVEGGQHPAAGHTAGRTAGQSCHQSPKAELEEQGISITQRPAQQVAARQPGRWAGRQPGRQPGSQAARQPAC